MRVLVTGACGYLGGLLIPALLDDPRISHVRGTDRMPAGRRLPEHFRYEHVVADLVAADEGALAALLADVEVVIHLAFRMAPRPGENLRGINVEAQARFLSRAARQARRLLVASAAAAYGFDATRDPINGKVSEDAALAPAGVEYADHKQALEQLLDRLEAEGAEVVRLRPTNVAGPGIEAARAVQLTGAVMLAPQTRHPIRQQLLHEADFVRGVHTLLDAPAGAYNLAPDDWMTLEAAAAMLGQRYVALPGWVLRPLADLAWRGGRSLFDGSWLAFIENPPIILANDKLKAQGWAPRHTTADTLKVMVESLRGAT